jgi:hypothetical protein
MVSLQKNLGKTTQAIGQEEINHAPAVWPAVNVVSKENNNGMRVGPFAGFGFNRVKHRLKKVGATVNVSYGVPNDVLLKSGRGAYAALSPIRHNPAPLQIQLN